MVTLRTHFVSILNSGYEPNREPLEVRFRHADDEDFKEGGSLWSSLDLECNVAPKLTCFCIECSRLKKGSLWKAFKESKDANESR